MIYDNGQLKNNEIIDASQHCQIPFPDLTANAEEGKSNQVYSSVEVDELLNLSQREWRNVVDRLFKYVFFKLKNKTDFGAHTESNLMINPADYYVTNAIEKLITGSWKWKRAFSIDEQLKRIVNSLISAQVRSYATNQFNESPCSYDANPVIIDTLIDNDDSDLSHKILFAAIEECTKNDKELRTFVSAYDDCSTFDEMQLKLSWPKKKLYALQKKLTRKVTKYLRSSSKRKLFDNT
ncbi:MAG: hypothetical protein VB079_00890 [Petrimonas sp.]|nr:hypothetical protein [Petrimonas sp.]MEA5080372.1 hypothetical protein [Dysgonamonadaceae bacterium]